MSSRIACHRQFTRLYRAHAGLSSRSELGHAAPRTSERVMRRRRGWRELRRPSVRQGVKAGMVRKTVHARRAKSPEAVDEAVRKARAEAGVELILVVYEDQAA